MVHTARCILLCYDGRIEVLGLRVVERRFALRDSVVLRRSANVHIQTAIARIPTYPERNEGCVYEALE